MNNTIIDYKYNKLTVKLGFLQYSASNKLN